MGILHTHVVLPLAEPESHLGLARRLRQIRRFERMSRQQQRAAQHQRLQKLLEHAYATVPFYRKQFDDSGIHPSGMAAEGPVPIAVTTRDMVREHSHSMISTALSSGCMRDKAAFNLHLNSWADYNPGDSVMRLWDAEQGPEHASNWKKRFYDQVLMRRVVPDSGSPGPEVLLRYEKRRPKVLYGHIAAIASLAEYLAAHGARHRPQVVIAIAEAPNEHERRLIESVFGTKLFVQYGSPEIGVMGAECSDHEGVHIHPWGTHVEFDPIGDTPDGPAYRVLATDLLNYRQPLVRYDTGTCVTLAEQMCSCGRPFPLIRHVPGSVAQGIVGADGGILPEAVLRHQMAGLCRNLRAVASLQVVQKDHRRLHLRYVLRERGSAASKELQSVCNRIDELFHGPMQWTLEQVDDLPREEPGKVPWCVSEMSAGKPVRSVPNDMRRHNPAM